MWGPFGGYLAALALASVREETLLPRPASLHCHYLDVGRFEEVDIVVTPLRAGHQAASFAVTMEQKGRAILQASAWTVASAAGIEHDTARAPEMPDPDAIPDPSAEDQNPFPFAQNFKGRPLEYDPPCPPVWQAWTRFGDEAVQDPWLDAARCLILLDLSGWPSAIVHHEGPRTPFLAQSLDLYASFHRSAGPTRWFLIDGHAPISLQGVLGWNSRVWSRAGELLATGAGQSIWRPL